MTVIRRPINAAPSAKITPKHAAGIRCGALAAAIAAAFALSAALPVGGLAATALVALAALPQAAQADWLGLDGSSGGSPVALINAAYIKLAIAPPGSPDAGRHYVAYADNSLGTKISVKKFNGSSWVAVGSAGFSVGEVEAVSLAIAPDGTPYVAYIDYSASHKATVMKFDGTDWVVVGSTGFSSAYSSYTSLAIASDGTPYVAYKDGNNINQASVMKFDGTNWVAVGSPEFSTGGASYLSLAIAPGGSSDAGKPYLTYSDAALNGKPAVWKFNGANWVSVGTEGFAGDVVSDNSLAFAADGTPYVAYMDYAYAGKATVKKFDGSDWVTVGSAGFSAGGASSVSLALAPNGMPYVAYVDSSTHKTDVKKFDSTNWVTVGSAGFSSLWSGNTSLAIAANGTPYVAFQDGLGQIPSVKSFFYGAILASSVPADNATNVAPGSTIVLTFSAATSIGGGNFKIVNDSDSTTETIDVTAPGSAIFDWNGNTLTITPGTALVASKNYHVEIDAGTFLNAANEPYAGIADATTLNFSIFTPTAPAAPIGLAATAGNGQLSVAFTPGADGGSAITGYAVSCTSSDGGTAGSNTGAASPIVVTGLTNGKTYTCTVTATNGVGTGSASTASSAANPLLVPTLTTPTATPSADLATLSLTSDTTGVGYFTLLASGGNCGTGAQVKAGADAGGSASIHGSLPLTANVAGSYTVRNLLASTTYKLCFTADDGATLQGAPVSANLTTNAANELTGLSWNAVGSAGFSSGGTYYESLAFAPDGTPYVVFQDAANGSKATVMKYSGAAWSVVGGAGFSAGMANYNSLAFAPDGTPYLAYVDNGDSAKATLKKFDGANWVTVGGAGFSAGTALYTSLAFAPDGAPYVAYSEFSNGRKATVKKFDGANWVVVGSAGFTTGQASSESLAFAPDGTPYLAFFDGDYFSATVMKFNGAAWVTVGSAGFSTAGPSYFSLAFAQDGTAHVAYRDNGNGNKATVMKYSGGAWVDVGGVGFSAVGGSSYTSLAFAPDGTPYVAYEDSGNSDKATVMKYSGGAWSVVGSADFSVGVVGYTSLAFAPDGTPYLAYQDNGNGNKATLMKLSAGATPPDGPTGITATAGNTSVTVSFTAPVNTGGAAISEYMVSCDTANRFSGAGYAFNQTGATSPITVTGLTNGTAYSCLVRAKNSAGYGNYSDVSASFTPSAPPAPTGGDSGYTPPSTTTTLPSGGGTAAPTNGQTVVITDNGKDGSSISLPSQTTMTGIDGSTTTTNNAIKVELPGTGTVSASSTSQGTKLGVTNVILPGTTTSVSTVTVDQGSASFTATKSGQAVAGLKNGIVVVSGASNSQVTVDTTGVNTKIGVQSSDTIVVPVGAQNVSGTSVDLPAPSLSGAATPVNVSVGGKDISVQATQSNTSMTFKVIDIGGVKTPVVEVAGAAQVSSSGDSQPLVSVSGSVIRSGNGSAGSGGQRCNTIIQASSETGKDVVHVVTCYIVLEPGTFSALSGGAGNGFAAIRDGIVWAGETAEFDKNGQVTGAYLGSKEGTSSAVGDDIVPGGNKFTTQGYMNMAFIPRLAGTPLRLNGADLNASLFKALNAALGVTTIPATPGQDANGVLNFSVSGDAEAAQKAQSSLHFPLNGEPVSVIPTRRIRVDTSRTDGVSVSSEGDVEVAAGGLVTIFAPSVGEPQRFAAKVAQALPGATSELRWNGTWKVMTSDGVSYVGRPVWNRQAQANGVTFAASGTSNVTYNDGTYSQLLVPDFNDYTTLQATFAKELKDAALTVLPNMDGTARATVNGQTYTLTPHWKLLDAAQVSGKPAWWLDNGVVYIKNADGTAQGFTVK